MKKVTITSNNISTKQWNVLLLELNLMKRAWKPYANIDVQAPGINKIVKWGTKRYDAKED
jgi:hypothetical protein